MPAFEIPSTLAGFKVAGADAFDPSRLALPTGESMLGPDTLLIPASRGYTSVWNNSQALFSSRFDESMRDSYINARAMRRDGFLLGLFEERILPTINRDWSIDVDDDRDPQQRLVRDAMKKLVREIPQFTLLKRALLDGVWFGRAGVAGFFNKNPDVDNLWCYSYSPTCRDHKWDSVHGDSIQYTFDGVPAIMMDSVTAGWYAANGAIWQGDWQTQFAKDPMGALGEFGLTSGGGDLRMTDRGGTALVLHRKYWRDRYAIHQHIRQKADYLEGELAGSVQGLGLRGQVYWLYVLRTQALAWMLAYMQSVGMMDMIIFYYPTGDNAARQRAELNANRIIGKAAFVVPRPVTYTGPMVEQLPMNSAGFKVMHEFLSDYFDRHIERLFVGQSMSSGADKGTGLGGTGRAEFARATKDEIIAYDTANIDETITRDIITPLKEYNFKWAKFPVRFKSLLPDLKAQEKVESGKVMISMGVPIKSSEFREAASYSTPEDGDEIILPMGPGGPPILTTMGPNGPMPPQANPMMAMMMPPPGTGGAPGQPPMGPPGMPPIGGGGPMLPPGPMGPSGPPGSAPPRPLLAMPPQPMARPIAPVAPQPLSVHPRPHLPVVPRPPLLRRPVRFAEGAAGAPPSTGPVMGAPAGSNTYIPSMGKNKPMGFTRYGDAGISSLQSWHTTKNLLGNRTWFINHYVPINHTTKGWIWYNEGPPQGFSSEEEMQSAFPTALHVDHPQAPEYGASLTPQHLWAFDLGGEAPPAPEQDYRSNESIPEDFYTFAKYERRNSPTGFDYGGKPYKRGQFIPGSVMFQHTPPRPKVSADFGSRTPPQPPANYADPNQLPPSAVPVYDYGDRFLRVGQHVVPSKHPKTGEWVWGLHPSQNGPFPEKGNMEATAAHVGVDFVPDHDEMENRIAPFDAYNWVGKKLNPEQIWVHTNGAEGTAPNTGVDWRPQESTPEDFYTMSRYADQGQQSSILSGSPEADAVARSLPPAAHERLKTRLLKFTPVPDVETSTKMWYDGDPNPVHPSKRIPAIAFYDPAQGELVTAPGGPNVDAQGAIAHEVFHALDQDENRQYFDLSGDPEWLDAWQKEIAGGQLSRYATSDEIEGFSEMGRHLHGGQNDRADIETRFPMSVGFLRKHGLV